MNYFLDNWGGSRTKIIRAVGKKIFVITGVAHGLVAAVGLPRSARDEENYCGVKSRRFATVFASSFCSMATSRSTILSKSPRFIMPLCECV